MTRRQLLKGLLGAAALPLLPKVAETAEPIKRVVPFEFLDSSPASEPRSVMRCHDIPDIPAITIHNCDAVHDIWVGTSPQSFKKNVGEFVRVFPGHTVYLDEDCVYVRSTRPGVKAVAQWPNIFTKPSQYLTVGYKPVRLGP